MAPRKTPVFLRAVRDDAPDSERRPKREVADAEIVSALRGGNTSAAGELHDRCVSAIDQALVRVLGGRQSDHDDLVQSTFEQLVRSLIREGFLGQCSLRTWSSRIATHVALNALRSKTRERRVILRGVEAPEPAARISEERAHQSRSELERVRVHLSRMNDAQVEVLLMHDVHGYGLSDIALSLGVTVAAAQSRLVRGRKELRERLEKDEKSGADS